MPGAGCNVGRDSIPGASGALPGTGGSIVVLLTEDVNQVAILFVNASFVGHTPKVKYSQDNGNYETIDASLVMNLESPGSPGLAISDGLWQVNLPGPGYMAVEADADAGGSGSIAVSIFVGQQVGGAVGQPPSLRTSLAGLQGPSAGGGFDTYIVQSSGGSLFYYGVAGDFLGNAKAMKISVPNYTSSLSASQALGILDAVQGGQWEWAVFYDIPFETVKYVGDSTDFDTRKGKTYAEGTTLDIGPVPPEYLENIWGNLASDGAVETAVVDGGTRAEVFDSGGNGLDALATAPTYETIGVSRSAAADIDITDGIWTTFAITVDSVLGGMTSAATVVGSNDSGFSTTFPLPLWKIGASNPSPSNSVNAVGCYAGSTLGFRYIRLSIAGSSGTFVAEIHVSSAPMAPPVTPVISAGQLLLLDQASASSGVVKSAPGNFYAANVENTAASPAYFTLYNNTAASGAVLMSVKIPAGASVYIALPRELFCSTGIAWSLGSARGGGGLPATGNVTTYYN